MKKILTIASIRPDCIRLCNLIKRLDANPFIEHVFLYTGQAFSPEMFDEILKDLDLRKPDYNLEIGAPGRDYNEQIADLYLKLPKVIREIKPDLVLTLGDTNGGCKCSDILRTEAAEMGFKLARIESGMIAGTFDLIEEGNRVAADAITDYFFAYTSLNKENLIKRGHDPNKIFVVGNTIVEPCNYFANKLGLFLKQKTENYVLCDIHRRANINNLDRFTWIVENLNRIAEIESKNNVDVLVLGYKRFTDRLHELGLENKFDIIPLQNYSSYLEMQYNAKYMISCSGSASEEAPLLKTPLFVPREETERPQAIKNNCAVHLYYASDWLKELGLQGGIFHVNLNNQFKDRNTDWLGDGSTSLRIAALVEDIVYGRL